MNKKNICILYGGQSGEHEVSIRSASSVVEKLEKEKYELTLIGIDKTGRWYLQTDAVDSLARTGLLSLKSIEGNRVSVVPADGLYACGSKLDADFIFPVLHGTFGEDGTVQGLIELVQLPYAGAGVMGSSVGMDKEIIKKIWISEGIDTVPFRSVNSEQIEAADFSIEDFVSKTSKEFGYPVFVKPVRAGSSVGISMAGNDTEFIEAVSKALRFDNRVMIEPAVDAREIECSVIGNMTAEAFLPGEIAPTHEFYDYEAKYIDEGRRRAADTGRA